MVNKKTKLKKEQIELAKAEMNDMIKVIKGEKPELPKNIEIKNILEKEKKLLEELSEKPLENIISMIIKKHTGTEKELKTALTGFLYILRVLSKKDGSGLLKVGGSSSAGKTNLVKTLLSCLPEEWVKEVGDLSEKALHHLAWKNEKILYIKEASGGERSTEALKLMDSGDGGFKACVTRGNPSDGFWVEELEIPIKFIITTRAEGIFDSQLENRMFSLSIDESPEQTFNVLLHRCKDFAGHIKKEEFGIIKKFILQLQPFDEIKVPYSYEFLNILEQKKIRVRRDIDKILSLCQTSAFLNQKNRPTAEKDGKKILFATPEDAYNIFILSFSSFQETLSGLSDRLQRVYDALDHDCNTYRDIAKKIGAYKKKIQRDIEDLDNKGLVEIDTSSNTHRIIKLEPLDQMKNDFNNYKLNLLAYTGIELSQYMEKCEIPIEWYDINDIIKWDTNWDKLRQINTPYLKKRDNNWDKSRTKKINFYEKKEILDYFGNKKKVIISHFCLGFVSLFVSLSSPYKSVSFKYWDTGTNRHIKRDIKADVELKVSIPPCPSVSLDFYDQRKDVKKLYDYVTLDSEKCFEWNDELNNYIKNELEKQDPEKWIEKQKEKLVLEEPILGKLRFLHDLGGENQ